MKRIISFRTVLVIIIASALSLFCCGCSDPNNDAKENDEEIVLENGLTLNEAKEYASFYKLQCNKVIFTLDKYKDTDVEFYIDDECTHELVAVFNFFIWDYNAETDDFRDDQEEARNVCEKYGFTSDNRLTSEWVLEEPYKAHRLLKELPEGIAHRISYRFWESYDKYILGISEEG